jgi:hypothetical protein
MLWVVVLQPHDALLVHAIGRDAPP